VTFVLVGGGVVLWRTTTAFQRTGFLQPGIPQISDNNTAAPAVAGGIEFQTTVSERTALVVRVLGRFGRGGKPIDSNPFVGTFGPFVLSPRSAFVCDCDSEYSSLRSVAESA
jgi:hypothetical protein